MAKIAPRAAPQERDGESTGEMIDRVATELIASRGYHGTSMRDVANAAGMQMSSLYHYHPSKQDLLIDLMRTTLRQLIAYVSAAMDAAGDDPAAQLEAGLRAHIRFHIERRNEVIIADSELRAVEAPNREEILALRHEHKALLRTAIQRGVRKRIMHAGRIGIVSTGITTICTDVASWYNPAGPLSIDKISDEIVQFIMRGLDVER